MTLQAAYIDDLSRTLEAVLQDPAFSTMFELARLRLSFDRLLDPFITPKP